MSKRLALSSLFVVSISLLFIHQPLLADVTGTILGTVIDQTGAAIPNAKVTVSNPDTGFRRAVTTDATGTYEFLAIPTCENYVVEVDASGFKKSVQQGLKLLVNQRYRADFRLAVGGGAQTVEVKASDVQVETASTQLGDVIQSEKMTSIPLNGRSYTDLLGLQAGVVPVTTMVVTDRPVSGLLSAGNLSVNGQRETGNAFLVNGGDVEEGRNNGASIVPNLDSIQEFRLLTSSFDAEYGRFSGAIVNVVTKSGTNDLHGTAFEFLRNDKLDARNYFDPGPRGPLKRNQFGGLLGGPIVKNRLFFFGDYQGTRQVQGITSPLVYVPSGPERRGDFSDVATTGYPALTGVVRGDNTNPHAMNDVLSTRLGYLVTSGESYWVPGCNTLADAQAGTCVFPGEVIPQSAWSPVAVQTLKFIPNPSGILSGKPIFSTNAENQVVRDDKWASRIDLSSARTGNWSLYYNFDDTTLLNPYPAFTSNVPGFLGITPSRAQQFTLSDTHTFGSDAVNEARISFTRLAATHNKPTSAALGSITTFGYVKGGLGVIPAVPSLEGVAPIGLAGAYSASFGLADGITGQFNNTYQAGDSFSKIIGPHTLKFGGDARYYQINERNPYTTNGFAQFFGNETGNDFADYLLGAPDNFIQATNQILDSRTKYFGAYAQDSYKVTSNMTLNYGVRWDVSYPYYDSQGKIYTIDYGVQSKVYPDAPTGYVFPGDPGISKTISPVRWHNFAPRLGLAYSPAMNAGFLGKLFGGPTRTSIRAAYGTYYNALDDRTLFSEVAGAPFGLFYVAPTQVYLEEPFKARRGQDPGQRFPYVIPVPGSNVSFAPFLPLISYPAVKVNNVLPYSEHYNFTVQRQLGQSMILSLGYVGSQGHHLMGWYESNPGNPALCLQVLQILGSGSGCGPGSEDQIYNLGGGNFVYGTRPHSVTSGRYLSQGRLDFGGSNPYQASFANSAYNSLQTSFQKTLGALRLSGAFTWSKSIDNASDTQDPADPYDLSIRSLSAFDVTRNFVVSYVYEMPFLSLTGSPSGPLRKFLEGWQISGVTRFTSGVPVTMSESGDRSLCGCPGADFPKYTGAPIRFFNPRTSPGQLFFSTDAFSQEDLGVPGYANRRFFHGPGLNNWDMALLKSTRATERLSVEFRAEFFNLFNHAQFKNPDGNFTASDFGRVASARDPRIGQVGLKLSF